MKKPCVIFNPAARGMKASRWKAELADLARSAAFKPTTGPGSARRLAATAVEEGYETIVAAGGDGTVNEVVNGIGDAPDGYERAALAVLPVGTTNVFAKEFGIGPRLAQAWEQLQGGIEIRIDLPWIDLSIDGAPQRRHFAQLASAGADAQTAEQVSWRLKKLLGYQAYLVAGLKVLAQRHPPFAVKANGIVTTAQEVMIGNGRFYAGQFPFFPFASARDGQLEVLTFPRINALVCLQCIWGLLRGRVHLSAGGIPCKASIVELTADERVAVQVDGEPIGQLPATIGLDPGRVRLVVPRPGPGGA